MSFCQNGLLQNPGDTAVVSGQVEVVIQLKYDHVFPPSVPVVISEPAGPDLGTPFTSRLPPELQVLKDQQVHQLAPKGSRSRILHEACKRMAEEAKKKVCGAKGNM